MGLLPAHIKGMSGSGKYTMIDFTTIALKASETHAAQHRPPSEKWVKPSLEDLTGHKIRKHYFS